MRLGPIGFLFAVALSWATVRAVMMWPEPAAVIVKPKIVWSEPIGNRGASQLVTRVPLATVEYTRSSALPPSPPGMPGPGFFPADLLAEAEVRSRVPAFAGMTKDDDEGKTHIPLRTPSAAGDRARLSLSAWALLREQSSAAALATAGQLGGSQAGVRVRYPTSGWLAMSGRLSAPLRDRLGKEAAIGLDYRPSPVVPITFTIERRAGLDRGGRDAFAAGVAGGVDNVPLPLGLRLDGYGQAGMVGMRSRDFYADGALRVERLVARSGQTRFGVGAGIWGGAQPGVSRMDVGPQIVAHIPAARGGIRVSAEWRQRIAGIVLPGSGPALSLGGDF